MFVPSLIILGYTLISKQRREQNWFKPEILELLKSSSGGISIKFRTVLGILSLFFMVVGLSRPVINHGEIDVESKNADITIAIDISKSMLAEDVYPNRIEFAKRKSIELINLIGKNRVGVIAFANGGYTVSPMTFDKSSLNYLIKDLNPKSISEAGTNFKTLLDSAEKFLEKSNDKYLIVFTDGGDGINYNDEVKKAKDLNIKVLTIGIGSSVGSPIKDDDGKFIVDNGSIFISKYNSAVEEFANATGGLSVRASTNNRDIKQIADEIAKLNSSENKKDRLKIYEELYIYPLIISLLLLFPVFFSLPSFNKFKWLFSRKIKTQNNLIILFLFSQIFVIDSKASSLLDWFYIQNANENIKNGDYQNAIANYKKLESSDEVNFNIGNSFYLDGNYSEAIENFKKVSDDLKQKALYNIGNSKVKLNDLNGAKESYENALQISEQANIRENLEWVKNRLKQNENNQSKNQENNQQQQNQDKQDQNQSQSQNSDSQENNQTQQKNSSDKKNDKRDGSDKSESENQNDKNSKSSEKKDDKNSDGNSGDGQKNSGETNDKTGNSNKKNMNEHNDSKKDDRVASGKPEENNQSNNQEQNSSEQPQNISGSSGDRESAQEGRIFNILNNSKGGTKIYSIPVNGKGAKDDIKPW